MQRNGLGQIILDPLVLIILRTFDRFAELKPLLDLRLRMSLLWIDINRHDHLCILIESD